MYNNVQNQQNYQNYPYPDAPQSRSINSFAIASMVMGIGSILLCCLGFVSLPMSALGILFAILSRRKGSGMHGMSIAGIWTSAVGMVLGLISAVYLIIIMIIVATPSLHHYLDPLYQQTYGMDYDEFMEYMGYPLD